MPFYLSGGSSGGQGHPEGAPAPRLALYLYLAPVGLDNLFDQRQPQADTTVAAGGATVYLIKALKDTFQLIVRDADPVVAHLQDQVAPCLCQVDDDFSACRGEF